MGFVKDFEEKLEAIRIAKENNVSSLNNLERFKRIKKKLFCFGEQSSISRFLPPECFQRR